MATKRPSTGRATPRASKPAASHDVVPAILNPAAIEDHPTFSATLPTAPVTLDPIVLPAMLVEEAVPAAVLTPPAEPEPEPAPAEPQKDPAMDMIDTAARAASDTIVDATETTTTATETAAAKGQTAFADVNGRAQAAMQKGTKMVEEMNEFAKGNVEALVESSRIAAKGVEAMGQDAAEFGRRSFESATAAFKNMASVKSPAELFKLQSEYVRSTFDALVAETSKNTEAMIKLAGDVAQPVSNRVAVAAEKVKGGAAA